MQDKITNNSVETYVGDDRLVINIKGQEQHLSLPSKVKELNFSSVLFQCLGATFTSALVTQIVLTVGLGDILFSQLVSAAVGVCLFVIGLHWAIKKQLPSSTIIYSLSALAGLVLGGL